MNEDKYKALSRELLGSDAESSGGDSDSSSGSGSSSDDDSDGDENEGAKGEKAAGGVIIDNTETNLVALRRTIYLTIHSSLDYEECAHKLMKMELKPGQEIELCHMFLDCCAEQRTYEKFYGLLAQRFCNINKLYVGPFEEIFKDTYQTTHRLDTNRLRNVGKFFAHLMFTDAIGWDVLSCIRMNEEDTTSSSRIFVKILFQELVEYMGLAKLNGKLKTSELQEYFDGLFPKDHPKNTRFAINFFTSIGLGGLTDTLREHLKSAPKPVQPQILEIAQASGSGSSSSSSSSSSDDESSSSSSSSEEDKRRKKKRSRKARDSSKKEKSSKKDTKRKKKDKKRKESSESEEESSKSSSSEDEGRKKKRSKRDKSVEEQKKRPRSPSVVAEGRKSRRSPSPSEPRDRKSRRSPSVPRERKSRRSPSPPRNRKSRRSPSPSPPRNRKSRSNSRDWKL